MPSKQPTIRTYATLPRTKPPVAAGSVPATIPERARLFCPPFCVPYEQGVLFYSSVDFEFRVRRDGVDFRFSTDNGETLERTITQHGHVLIHEVSESWDRECLAVYRERVSDEKLPRTFDREKPAYPDQLVEVTREEGTFGYIISVWTGVVIELEPGRKLYIKDPPHVQMADRGFRLLDAVVESDRWHGHFGAVLRAYRTETWLRVCREEPLFQALVYRLGEDRLKHVDLADAPQETFMNPLRWNAFDPYRRNSLGVGKYQNQLRRLPAWDCAWQEHDQRFADRRANIGLDTRLTLTLTPAVTVSQERVRVVFSAEDEIEVEEPALRPFAVGLGDATRPFTTGDALRWSKAGMPGYPTEEEIVENLRTLVWHGLLAIEGRTS